VTVNNFFEASLFLFGEETKAKIRIQGDCRKFRVAALKITIHAGACSGLT
jgi:hypothetical protein